MRIKGYLSELTCFQDNQLCQNWFSFLQQRVSTQTGKTLVPQGTNSFLPELTAFPKGVGVREKTGRHNVKIAENLPECTSLYKAQTISIIYFFFHMHTS